MATTVNYIITGTYTPFMVFIKENGVIIHNEVIQNSGEGDSFTVPNGFIYDLEVHDTGGGSFIKTFPGDPITTVITTTFTTTDPCASFDIGNLIFYEPNTIGFEVFGADNASAGYLITLYDTNDPLTILNHNTNNENGIYSIVIPQQPYVTSYIVKIDGLPQTPLENCSAQAQIDIPCINFSLLSINEINTTQEFYYVVEGTGGQDFTANLYNINDIINPINTSIETGDGLFKFPIPQSTIIETYFIEIIGVSGTSIETCTDTVHITTNPNAVLTTPPPPTTIQPIFISLVPKYFFGITNNDIPYQNTFAEIVIGFTTDGDNTQNVSSSLGQMLDQNRTFDLHLNNFGYTDVQFQIINVNNVNNINPDFIWENVPIRQNIEMISGVNNASITIKVRNNNASIGSLLNWEATLINTINGWGVDTDANDLRYILKDDETPPTGFGYTELNDNSITIFQGIAVD